MNDVVRLLRWRWMGHIFRSKDESVQDIPEWKSGGSMGRERPRDMAEDNTERIRIG